MEARTELSSTGELRERARRQVMDGPVTEGYDLDPKRVVGLLNEALATEWVCALRYKRHYFVAEGITVEEEHADDLVDLLEQER
jgi:bacterioferritin